MPGSQPNLLEPSLMQADDTVASMIIAYNAVLSLLVLAHQLDRSISAKLMKPRLTRPVPDALLRPVPLPKISDINPSYNYDWAV